MICTRKISLRLADGTHISYLILSNSPRELPENISENLLDLQFKQYTFKIKLLTTKMKTTARCPTLSLSSSRSSQFITQIIVESPFSLPCRGCFAHASFDLLQEEELSTIHCLLSPPVHCCSLSDLNYQTSRLHYSG